MTKSNETQGIRHRLADRLFHWVMAASVIVLGASAFLPMVGWKFDWIPIHWISGIVLTAAVAFHLFRVFLIHGVGAMVPRTDDAKEILRDVSGSTKSGLAPAKYDALQKGYHLAAASTVSVLVITGLLMLAKIDTTFWNRNPAILTETTWGIVYVLHGAAALLTLFLFIVHVYFAILPEHWKLLLSMIHGRGPTLARRDNE